MALMDGLPARHPGPELLKALTHPLRFSLLGILVEREASPNEMARELDQAVGTVAYHVRRLRDLGAIELVRTAQRRGATQHFYRATVRPWFDEEELERLDPATRRALAASTLGRIVTRAMGGLARGAFDAADAGLAWIPMALDPEGHREAITLVEQVVGDLVAVAERADARAAVREPGEPDPRTPFEASVVLYEGRPT